MTADEIRVALRCCRCLVPKDCPDCRPMRDALRLLAIEGCGEYMPQTGGR